MRTLYHFSLCPFSRKIRFLLYEKGIDVTLKDERNWERRNEFLRINPAGTLPVLVEEDGEAIAGHYPICEFIEETQPKAHSFIGKTPEYRAEVRRLTDWFDKKFHQEVSQYILSEKVVRFFTKEGAPNSSAIRAGKTNIHYHLEYIAFLIKQRRWLAGDELSLADITAAAHLSVLDYLGDIPWENHGAVKDWYALVKSRPGFRPFLEDKVLGFTPPEWYANPDF